MDNANFRRPLSPGQRVLAAALLAITATVQLLIVRAYTELSRSTNAFRHAADETTYLIDIHRETLLIAGIIERLELPNGLDDYLVRRSLLDRQMDIFASLSGGGRREVDFATKCRTRLTTLDAAVAQLGDRPAPAAVLLAQPALRQQISDLEVFVKDADDRSQDRRVESINAALRVRAGYQRLLMASSALMIFAAVALALSLRRRVKSEFTAAYEQLVTEARERAAAEEALRESERRFRSLVHNSSDIFTVIDAGGAIRYQSPAIERILDYAADDLVGRSIHDLVHPDDSAAARRMVRESLDRPGVQLVRELRLLTSIAIGADRYFEMTVTNLLDEPGIAGLVLNYRDVTDRHGYERQLTHAAFHDDLTGLGNRALFEKLLGEALKQRGRRVAVFFIDLDHFKVVNDTLGHQFGDLLLGEAADRLASCLRSGDFLARLGGDEFTVLVPDIATDGVAVLMAGRMIEAMRKPFELDGRQVVVSASVGIAVGTAGATEPDVLLRDADAAMYQAKDNGRDGYKVFSSVMHDRMLHKLELETRLRRAIDLGEFYLAYQPIFDVGSTDLLGFEALVRWRQTDGTVVSPAEFIPLAEETGLIMPLGRWVLAEAARQLAAWSAEIAAAAHCTMNVNVSSRQLRDLSLLADVSETLDETGLAPSRLCLELTESAIMTDVDAAVAVLGELRDMGVRVAIDDFGTGYSSMNYLRRLPLDTLKIDKDFIDRLGQNVKDTSIVQAVIDLGHTLDARVTAEGIETADQLELLRLMGCDEAQGFLLGRPMDAVEAAAVLREAPRRANSLGAA